MENKDIKIIMATNKTKREAEEHLKRGTIVYEYKDYLKNFDEYAGELEEEYKQQLKHEVETSDDGPLVNWDMDLVTFELGPYAHVCASVCIDQLEQHKAGRQNDGSWNYPTLFDLADQEAINEYNKMWDQVANWP